MSSLQDILPETLIYKNNFFNTEDILKKSRYVAFYYSKKTCPYCEKFTPQLIDFYNKSRNMYFEQNLTYPNWFEIVFISKDISTKNWDENINKMPWPIVNYYETNNVLFDNPIKTVPALILFDNLSGKVIDVNARITIGDLYGVENSISYDMVDETFKHWDSL